MFAMVTAPVVLTIFVPLCLAGDRLAKAREDLAVRAMRGPWLEEPAALRDLRRGIMQAAGGETTHLRGLGIGPMIRPTCMSALNSWFSFLQMMLNLKFKAIGEASH